jgi:hypothetical protein
MTLDGRGIDLRRERHCDEKDSLAAATEQLLALDALAGGMLLDRANAKTVAPKIVDIGFRVILRERAESAK